MIEAYTTGVGEVVTKLETLDDRLRKELLLSIARLTITAQDRVRNDCLSGQVLGVRSGRLKRSIQQTTQSTPDAVSGIVSTNVFYGIGWETGWPNGGPGARMSADLDAAKAKFDVTGSADTFKNGNPKQRAFLVPTLREMAASGEIESGIRDAAVRAAK